MHIYDAVLKLSQAFQYFIRDHIRHIQLVQISCLLMRNGAVKALKLIRFRKETPVALWGDYREHRPEDKKLYVYERNYRGQKLLVICSFTADQVRFEAPEGIHLAKGECVLANYDMNFVIANGFTTRPYELRVYLFN